MSGRGLSKLARCSNCAVKSATRGPQTQRRTFTNSSIRQKHGSIPAFTEVSSPELLNILNSLRERLILPTHLSQEQKSLIYKYKNKKLLATEPVQAVIGGEEFRLMSLDPTKDIPNARKALSNALSLFKTKGDWDNLPRLLEGLKNAGVKLKPNQLIAAVRIAGKAGRQDVILECVRRAADTGFELKDPELTRQVMWWLQYKALISDWKAEETKKALSWVEMILVLLEDDTHAGCKAMSGKPDPRQQLEIIGIPLQLAAMRASKHLDTKDEEGKVTRHAARLMAIQKDFVEPEENQVLHRSINPWLCHIVPVFHGMKVAQTVLDPTLELAGQLKEKTAELEPKIWNNMNALAEATSSWEEKPLGLWLYENLLAPKSS